MPQINYLKSASILSNIVQADCKDALLKLLNQKHIPNDVEKLNVGATYPLFSYRVNQKARIIFTAIHGHLYVLDYLPNHEYAKSNFLTKQYLNHFIDTTHFPIPDELNGAPVFEYDALDAKASELIFKESTVYDGKLIELTDVQEDTVHARLPALINGVAGCGKSLVMLSMLKSRIENCPTGETLNMLVLTKEKRLADALKKNWDDMTAPMTFEQPHQVTITTLHACFNIPENDLQQAVRAWDEQRKQSDVFSSMSAEAIYSEFKICSGLTLEQYCALTDKGNLIGKDERPNFFALYERFKNAHPQYFPDCPHDQVAAYDLVAVDEAHNLTSYEVQLAKMCAKNEAVALCYDGKQDLKGTHPFRLAIAQSFAAPDAPTRLHTLELDKSHRCSRSVAQVADQCLALSRLALGGTQDKYDVTHVEAFGDTEGSVDVCSSHDFGMKHGNTLVNGSITEHAIITSADKLEEISDQFPQCLVFTLEEIQGLGFKNIYGFGLLSENPKALKNGKSILTTTNQATHHRAKKNANPHTELAQLAQHLYTAATRSSENLVFIENNLQQHWLKPLINKLFPETSVTDNQDKKQEPTVQALQMPEKEPMFLHQYDSISALESMLEKIQNHGNERNIQVIKKQIERIKDDWEKACEQKNIEVMLRILQSNPEVFTLKLFDMPKGLESNLKLIDGLVKNTSLLNMVMKHEETAQSMIAFLPFVPEIKNAKTLKQKEKRKRYNSFKQIVTDYSQTKLSPLPSLCETSASTNAHKSKTIEAINNRNISEMERLLQDESYDPNTIYEESYRTLLQYCLVQIFHKNTNEDKSFEKVLFDMLMNDKRTNPAVYFYPPEEIIEHDHFASLLHEILQNSPNLYIHFHDFAMKNGYLNKIDRPEVFNFYLIRNLFNPAVSTDISISKDNFNCMECASFDFEGIFTYRDTSGQLRIRAYTLPILNSFIRDNVLFLYLLEKSSNFKSAIIELLWANHHSPISNDKLKNCLKIINDEVLLNLDTLLLVLHPQGSKNIILYEKSIMLLNMLIDGKLFNSTVSLDEHSPVSVMNCFDNIFKSAPWIRDDIKPILNDIFDKSTYQYKARHMIQFIDKFYTEDEHKKDYLKKIFQDKLTQSDFIFLKYLVNRKDFDPNENVFLYNKNTTMIQALSIKFMIEINKRSKSKKKSTQSNHFFNDSRDDNHALGGDELACYKMFYDALLNPKLTIEKIVEPLDILYITKAARVLSEFYATRNDEKFNKLQNIINRLDEVNVESARKIEKSVEEVYDCINVLKTFSRTSGG